MKEYKLSANSIEIITQFLKSEFDFNWNGSNTPQMLNNTDCFVFIGQIPNETKHGINKAGMPTIKILSYLNGLHFDILTSKELELPNEIIEHIPINPIHKFS